VTTDRELESAKRLNREAISLAVVAKDLMSEHRSGDFDIEYLAPRANGLLERARGEFPNATEVMELPYFKPHEGGVRPSVNAIWSMSVLLSRFTANRVRELEPARPKKRGW
jgi:hypothetical protein